jgi:hypothetical protein
VLLGLFDICSLQAKGAIPIVIEAHIQFLILCEKFFKLLIREGLTVIAEDAFE